MGIAGIPGTTAADADLATLQHKINATESVLGARLIGLSEQADNGNKVNAHVYDFAANAAEPLSTLFVVTGPASEDPAVKTWLANHAGSKVIFESSAFVLNVSCKVAVIR